MNPFEAPCARISTCGRSETFEIRHHGYRETYRVLGLPTSRVGAALVPNFLVVTTPAEELERKEFLLLAQKLTRPRGQGRPTKKDRRDLDGWEG